MKFAVHVHLIILSIDLETGDRYILSTSNEKCKLPSYILTKLNTIEYIINNELETYIDLDPTWIKTKCVDVQRCVIDSELDIYYAGMIPKSTQLKNGAVFLPIETTQYPPHISQAISKYEFI